jgi:porin
MAPRLPVMLALSLVVCLQAPAVADSEVANRSEIASRSQDIWKQDKLTGDWGGLRKRLEDAGVNFEVNEQSEPWANLTGGLRTGGTYNGLTTPSLKLDLAKLMSWKGAAFFVNAYQIHGFGPSTTLAGNQQFISNIEAAPSTKLFDLWLEQTLFNNQANIRVGQEGMNEEFMTSEASAVFLNGSFGFPDLAERDLPSGGPNYPLATPMVRAKVKITDRLSYIGAIFNGDPAGPGEGDPQLRDASGTAFRLQDPPLIVNEVWFRVGGDKPSEPLPGIYKIGAWAHTGSFGLSKDNYTGLPLPYTIPAPLYRGNFAVYALADQMVWRKPGTKDEGVTLFGLIMAAPQDRNAEDFYAEGGFNWKGIIEGRPNDMLGIGFAFAQTSNAFRRLGEESIGLTGSGKLYVSNETIVEATYLYQAAPCWTIQPDIQYVINPGASLPPGDAGITTIAKNALVIGVRTKIDF